MHTPKRIVRLSFIVTAALAAIISCRPSALAQTRTTNDNATEAAPQAQAERPVEEGFESIFDGQSLDGWKGIEKFWSVRDGAITGETTAENPAASNTFLIWQGGDVGDFVLRCKFRIVGHNSGIQYRSEQVGEPDEYVAKGYQADIDATHKYIGINYGEKTGRAIIGDRAKTIVINDKGEKEVTGDSCDEEEFLKSVRKEDWNEYEISAIGNRLIHKINGFVTSDVTDNHPDAMKTGIIALQVHTGPPMVIQFKEMMLKQIE